MTFKSVLRSQQRRLCNCLRVFAGRPVVRKRRPEKPTLRETAPRERKTPWCGDAATPAHLADAFNLISHRIGQGSFRLRVGCGIAAIVVVAALGLTTSAFSEPAQESQQRSTQIAPHGAAGWAIKGVTVVPATASDVTSSGFRASVREAHHDGANTIGIVVAYVQPAMTSSQIRAGPATPSPTALSRAIAYVHSLGMKVALKVFFDSTAPASNGSHWRWWISPTNRARWFARATELEVGLARLNPDLIIIGTELGSLSTASDTANTTGWEKLIAAIRRVYSGQLTYEAQTPTGDFSGSEAQNLRFWNRLDFASLSAYTRLPVPCNASVAQLETAWSVMARRYYAPLERRLDRPIVFGEIGYSSYRCDAQRPYVYEGNADRPILDLGEQRNAYAAFFRFWARQSYMRGALIWNWLPSATAGGPTNLDFTPQGKPAEAVLREAYRGGRTSVGEPPSPTSTSATSTTLTTPTTSTPTTNTPTTISTATTSPAPSDPTVAIWWPVSSYSFTHAEPYSVQQFQAVLQGRPLDQYEMFWSVDGGQQTLMSDGQSPSGSPAKVATVDLNPWTWSDTGTYAVTFTATDLTGQVLASGQVTITIGV
jgi:hypothetical protein